MSDTKPLVIHRVSVLDLVVETWVWPFAETRRAEIDAHFADKQRERPALFNGRVLLGRNPVFAGDRLSASYFETDFASFLAWRDWGFPDPSRVQRFWHGRASCADGAFVLGEMGQHTRTPGASIFRPARPISTTSGTARSTFPAASRANSRRRPGLRPANIEIEPHWHCVYTGPALAMIRMLQVDMPADAVRDRIVANLAAQHQPELSAIHLVRGVQRSHLAPCRVLSRPSSKPNSHPNSDVQVALILCGCASVAASNTLDIWSRYQCDRRQQEQEKRSAQKIIQGGFHAGAQSCTPVSSGCLPQSRCWGWRLPPRPRRRRSRSA